MMGIRRVLQKLVQQFRPTPISILEKDDWYRYMINGIEDPIMLLDRSGTVIAGNKVLSETFGKVEGQNIDKMVLQDWTVCTEDGQPFKVENWLHHQIFQSNRARMSKIVRTQKVKFPEIVRWQIVTAVAVKSDAQGLPILVMIHTHDITEIRQQQSMISEQQAALINASRLTTMGEMAGGIAHEINSPLTVIVGRIEQLQRMIDDQLFDANEFNMTLQRVSDTVFRIKKLMTSLKSISRNYENDPFEPFDVAAIIQDTLELCAEGMKWKGIRLIQNIPEGQNVVCRPWQISQVILNLLNNAKDAVQNLPDKWIRIEVEFSATDVIFSVTDSGQGIRPDLLDKIMQPFFTTKAPGTGTGLGLSISLAIAQAHAGTLYVNARAKNTQFILKIPKNPKIQR